MTQYPFHPAIEQRLAELGATGPRRDLPGPVLDQALGGDDVPEDWDLVIEDRTMPGPHGPIPVRVYTPVGAAPEEGRPALVWNHGGGFAWGDLDMPEAHEVARGVAGRADAVVVSVDYRLCPPFEESGRGAPDGVRFPVPLDDVVAAFDWTVASAAELGVDPRRVAIGGASAGGALAAGATLRLADEGRAPWQALLMYPVVHPLLPDPTPAAAGVLDAMPSCLVWGDGGRAMNENYLGGPLESATPYAFAGLSSDLSGFPSTLVESCEFDDLRRSSERFAQQLRDAGVDVEEAVSEGVPHGHLNWVGFPVTAASVDRMAARLGRPVG